MEIIGRNKAAFIKSILPTNRSPEMQKQLEAYEKDKEPDKEAKKRLKEYSMEIFNATPKKAMQGVNSAELYQSFKFCFEANEGKELSIKADRLNDYKTLIYYFSNNPEFYNCENLSDRTVPSLSKGLLIIGDFGNGKSSCLKAMSKALQPYYTRQFKMFTCNEVVSIYEHCETSYDKRTFWNRMSNSTKAFDDLSNEVDASNFGKRNVFKEIIERRYDNKVTTYFTANYDINHIGNIDKAMEMLAERYGARVYDRLFEMCNIIEFKGKSFRK